MVEKLAKLFSMYNGDFAILTRGYSRENGYQWKASWLDRSDSSPDRRIRDDPRLHQLENTLLGDVPGLAVARQGSQFAVLLNGILTDYRSDVSPGRIYARIAFLDLSEEGARSLVCAFLRDWETNSKAFVSLIKRDKRDPEWDFDPDQVRAFVNALPRDEGVSGLHLSKVQKTYRSPEDDGFKALENEISGRGFDARDGLRIVIGHPYDAAAQLRICEEAGFRVIPATTPQSEVPDSKKKETDPLLSDSNKGLKNLVILCAVAAIATAVYVTIFKKKEPPEGINLQKDEQIEKGTDKPPEKF